MQDFTELMIECFFPLCVISQHLYDLYILSCSRSPPKHNETICHRDFFFYPFKGTVIRYTKPVILRMKLCVTEISFCVKIRAEKFYLCLFRDYFMIGTKTDILTCQLAQTGI